MPEPTAKHQAGHCERSEAILRLRTGIDATQNPLRARPKESLPAPGCFGRRAGGEALKRPLQRRQAPSGSIAARWPAEVLALAGGGAGGQAP